VNNLKTDGAATGSGVIADRSELIAGSAAAVCIAGMHRSGTSMVAGLLNKCGLFLGLDEELRQPAPDNEEGFWENLNFCSLNDHLLAQFGGTWNDPPDFASGWEFAPDVSSSVGKAEDLITRFHGCNNWGWKDPRNSLTIPFWRRLIPDLKVVVCVRNPLEVARSLFVRGDSTNAAEFQLWLAHYRQLLATIPPASRIVTHYHSYFQNPRAEVQRISTWLGLNVSDETVDHACTQISTNLRHHYLTTADLIEADAPAEVRDLYLRLCAEAGPIYQEVFKPEVEPPTPGGSQQELYSDRMQLLELETSLRRNERRREAPENELAGSRANLQTPEAELSSLKPFHRALNTLRALKERIRRS
jgi:hypothetical protein